MSRCSLLVFVDNDTAAIFLPPSEDALTPRILSQGGMWEFYQLMDPDAPVINQDEVMSFVNSNYKHTPSGFFDTSPDHFLLAHSNNASNVLIGGNSFRDLVFAVFVQDPPPALPEPSPLSSELSQPQRLDVIPEEVQILRRDDVVKKAKSRKPPSTGAQAGEMRRQQRSRNVDAIYNGRPISLSPTPITIYHPIFSQFARDVSDDSALTKEELETADNFISISSVFYVDEGERQEKLQNVLASLFRGCGVISRETTFPVGTSSVKPDGHASTVCPNHGFAAAFRLFMEMKNGVGEGGCDPLLQAECVYIALISRDTYASIRAMSCCPTFLLAIDGPYFVIEGAIFADRFMAQHFTDFIYLGANDLHNDLDNSIIRIARIFRALRKALLSLEEFYRDLPAPETKPAGSSQPSSARALVQNQSVVRSTSKPGKKPSFDFVMPSFFGPAFTEFKMDGRTFKLTYTARLLPEYISKAVFKATCIDDDAEVHHTVAVKFSHTYSKQAHECLANRALRPLAPKLWFCHRIPALGDWWAIVMDYVEERSMETKKVDKEQVKRDLRDAVDSLHGERLVHGDVRRANILIMEDRAMVVDFDWAGTEDEVRYPASMNKEIKWPEDATVLGLITHEHDLNMLRKLEDEIDSEK